MELKVSDLPLADQPLYRMVSNGTDHLTNVDLLSLVIGTSKSIHLAQCLFSKYKSLECIADCSIEELAQIKGIGKSIASKIISAFHLAKRMNTGKIQLLKYDSITSPDQMYNLLRNKISNSFKEHFYVISLDTRNNFIGLDEISVGTLTASLVHPRETFESAIKRHAAQIIIAHNHPSGGTEPSEDDLKITKRIVDAGKIMGIEVLDHIIFTPEKYLSFKEKNLI